PSMGTRINRPPALSISRSRDPEQARRCVGKNVMVKVMSPCAATIDPLPGSFDIAKPHPPCTLAWMMVTGKVAGLDTTTARLVVEATGRPPNAKGEGGAGHCATAPPPPL